MMEELIALCLGGDQDAWHRLWEIVSPSIRRPSRMTGDVASVDDAEQEFYLFLSEDGCRRLRSFRGDGEAEFRGYIRVIAVNFLSSHRAARRRAEARELGIWPDVARPEVEGPTEPQLLAVLREFVALASAEDRRRLCVLLGPDEDSSASPIGSRTLRRWRRDLVASYLDRVL